MDFLVALFEIFTIYFTILKLLLQVRIGVDFKLWGSIKFFFISLRSLVMPGEMDTGQTVTGGGEGQASILVNIMKHLGVNCTYLE